MKARLAMADAALVQVRAAVVDAVDAAAVQPSFFIAPGKAKPGAG